MTNLIKIEIIRHLGSDLCIFGPYQVPNILQCYNNLSDKDTAEYYLLELVKKGDLAAIDRFFYLLSDLIPQKPIQKYAGIVLPPHIGKLNSRKLLSFGNIFFEADKIYFLEPSEENGRFLGAAYNKGRWTDTYSVEKFVRGVNKTLMPEIITRGLYKSLPSLSSFGGKMFEIIGTLSKLGWRFPEK